MTASESRRPGGRLLASVYTFYRFAKVMRCQRDAMCGMALADLRQRQEKDFLSGCQ
jgi:hypothetical protein